MPGSVLSTLFVLTHLSFKIIIGDEYYYFISQMRKQRPKEIKGQTQHLPVDGQDWNWDSFVLEQVHSISLMYIF